MTTPPGSGPSNAGRSDPQQPVEVAVPAPPPAKPRLLQDGRDMFWSMFPLVLGCILLAGVLGMCSFAPTGPGQGPVPMFDAPTALKADAEALHIPIRVPALPDGWRSNSGARQGIEGGRTGADGRPARAVVSRVGYLSPGGMYLALDQSDADEEKLVGAIHDDMVPAGSEDVDGVRWTVYQGDGDTEPVWTTRLSGPDGTAQLAITGAGDTDEFRTLAAATQRQPPLTTAGR